jgi:hypothetical protein
MKSEAAGTTGMDLKLYVGIVPASVLHYSTVTRE